MASFPQDYYPIFLSDTCKKPHQKQVKIDVISTIKYFLLGENHTLNLHDSLLIYLILDTLTDDDLGQKKPNKFSAFFKILKNIGNNEHLWLNI